MELSLWQKELLALLSEKGLPQADLYSVMLVLTKEEKGRAMIAFLKERTGLTADEICEQAGKIAFGENA